ncbi:hypothetical protein PENTCL1PPCAC_8591, partial [Pristionchus entomophagus]
MKFAIDQPYFIGESETIECFEPDVAPFHLVREEKMLLEAKEFFMYKDRAFGLWESKNARSTIIARTIGKIVIIELYTEHESFTMSVCAHDWNADIYLMTKESFMIIHNDLSVDFIKSKHRVAGVHEGSVYVSGEGRTIRLGEQKKEVTSLYKLTSFALQYIKQHHGERGTKMLSSDFAEVGVTVGDQDITQTRLYKEYTVFHPPLGKGSFGLVYKVMSKADGAYYAVKMIIINGNNLARCQQEADTMKQLEHPGIVRYFSSWKDDIYSEQFEEQNNGQRAFYLKMELCTSSLSAWLSANQSDRDIETVKRWFKKIISAMKYVHDLNIIHRDLKPDNILLDENDDPKICDFGIAALNGENTTFRTEAGTVTYIAPEQDSMVPMYSWRVDIFALGLILLEMCLPIEGDKIQMFDSFREENGQPVLSNSKKESPSADMCELICKLAYYNKENRPNCEEILAHPALQYKYQHLFKTPIN